MKKYFPFLIFGLGIIVLVGGFLVMNRKPKTDNTPIEEEEVTAEIPLNLRPITTLTPKSDGHWLNLKIENIKVAAASVDYELIYKTRDGNTQGVPGSVTFSSGETIERELLLGSESSGKFRYDEGVKEGTLTLRFRSDRGKLIGKLSTDFRMYYQEEELKSADEKFSFILNKAPKAYFIVMNVFGIGDNTVTPNMGPYGVLSSDSKYYDGSVDLGEGNYMRSTGGEYTLVDDPKSSKTGFFITSN